MAFRPKATQAEIVAAYRRTGSVWKAGLALGMAGQSIHERLRAIGYPIAHRAWTKEETDELARLVANGVPLTDVAHRLGRTYAGVACRASRTEARSGRQRRAEKIRLAPIFDKAATDKHLGAIEISGLPVTRYALANGLPVEVLVQAIQRHYPERWLLYVTTCSALPQKICEYCEAPFQPANGKQRFCSRACSSTARDDRIYFGGNRRKTVGLVDGVCQICGRTSPKGLSSHHALGKENDPENLDLVALCRLCHKIVGELASSDLVDDPKAWEALIALAWTRRHGSEADDKPKTVYAEVVLEVWADEPTD